TGRRENPINVGFHFASGFARSIEVELSGDWVFPATGHLHARLDPWLALLVRHFQPVHFRRLIAHSAVTQAGRSLGYVLHDLGRAIHLADATAEFALLAVLL